MAVKLVIYKNIINMNNRFNLTGKTALITGSAGLLGHEHARALLENGCSVVLTDLDSNKLEKQKIKLIKDFEEEKIHTFPIDVSSESSIEDVCSDLDRQGLALSILINNAAIDPKVDNKNTISESSRLENFSLNQWNLELSVGLTGAFLCSKIFGSSMVSNSNSGVILNIASDLSVISPDQRIYHEEGKPEHLQPVKPVTYSVIKTGLVGLTRYTATYWADKNIRCNSLSPGGVEGEQNEEFKNKLKSLIPSGRMAKKDEYHAAIQFLCSDASLYMNGQNIVMDGGRSVW